VKLPPVYTGGYVAAPVKAWLFQDHVQSISGMLIRQRKETKVDFVFIGILLFLVIWNLEFLGLRAQPA
jgi:hypothetical protein